MAFNYRIFKEWEEIKPNEVEEVFTIRQIGYDINGKPNDYTEKGYSPIGNTQQELMENLGQMLQAFTKPILTEEDFNGTTVSK